MEDPVAIKQPTLQLQSKISQLLTGSKDHKGTTNFSGKFLP